MRRQRRSHQERVVPASDLDALDTPPEVQLLLSEFLALRARSCSPLMPKHCKATNSLSNELRVRGGVKIDHGTPRKRRFVAE